MNFGPASVAHAATAALRGLADLLLPEVCSGCDGCGVTVGGLCDACNIELLSLVSLRYCPRCGATMGPNLPIRSEGCWQCPNPLPRFGTVMRLGPYAGPLRQGIRRLKYRHQDVLTHRLSEMLAEAVRAGRSQPPIDLAMPVPMHWWRRLIRGLDHSRVLARRVAACLHLPAGSELIRIRDTPPQVHLSRSRRIANMRGAFSVTCAECLRGAHVLLIDDVTTTGATANEATRTLLSAGASRVTLAVLAKTDTPRAYADRAAGDATPAGG